VRKIAEFSGFNRGVVYEDLKWLQEEGLVDFYEKENKQWFVANAPEQLTELAQRAVTKAQAAAKELASHVSELKSLYNQGGGAPVARYFEQNEINKILEDVLETCEAAGEKEYRTYSAAGIREYLYDGFESFSDARVAKGISVKVIAVGQGGELRGLDERKWLKSKNDKPTYIILYPGKSAYISLNAHQQPVGVVIENAGVFETQKIIFDELWSKL
jgi:sugar-specific transcriptional regulator TrmB